jgi:hypothetical protein
LKTPNTKSAGGVAQVMSDLPSKHKAWSSNPSTATKKKKKKKKVQVAVSLFLTGNERIKPENSQAWWHPTVHPATWEQRSGGSQ